MLSRRALLVAPVALLASRAAFGQSAAGRRMRLCMHTNTSSGAGYRAALEGWAKAGIRNVELNASLIEAFLKTDTLDAAKRILTDNALTPVHATVPGDRKSTRLNSSHGYISYAVFCLKKKIQKNE